GQLPAPTGINAAGHIEAKRAMLIEFLDNPGAPANKGLVVPINPGGSGGSLDANDRPSKRWILFDQALDLDGSLRLGNQDPANVRRWVHRMNVPSVLGSRSNLISRASFRVLMSFKTRIRPVSSTSGRGTLTISPSCPSISNRLGALSRSSRVMLM